MLIRRQWDRGTSARRMTRHLRPSIGIGAAVLLTVGLSSCSSSGVASQTTQASGTSTSSPAPSTLTLTPPATLQTLVSQASSIKVLPAKTTPTLAGDLNSNWGQPMAISAGCAGYFPVTTLPIDKCTFGDPNGKHTIVILGDSHATMWLPALDLIGRKMNLKVIDLWKSNCPSVTGQFTPWITSQDVPYPQCTQFKQWAIKEINTLDPSIVILSNLDGDGNQPHTAPISASAWQAGIEQTLNSIQSPNTKKFVLGQTPNLANDVGGGATCLAAHESDVQYCSEPVAVAMAKQLPDADKNAAESSGGQFIDVVPWMCSSVCTAIVGTSLVYVDIGHITAPMAELTAGAFEAALDSAIVGAAAN
jgi:hypothetical protein